MKRTAAPTSDNSINAIDVSKKRTKQVQATRPELSSFDQVHKSVQAKTKALLQTDDDCVFDNERVIYLTQDHASWVYHVPQWHDHVFRHHQHLGIQTESYDDWFNALWQEHPAAPGVIKMFGRDVRTPRYQQAYGATHRFSGATFASKPFPRQLQPTVELLQSMLTKGDSSETFLSAGLLNWYKDGEHYIGPHSDDALRLVPNSPVVSVTYGATRRFVFTRRDSTKIKNVGAVERVTLELGDGDLLIMGGTTQTTHKHALPKMKQCIDRRINLTLRCFQD
ncbi:hypothetical protein PINS_up002803 [Pythium insidiosum]|nr:hypothetical protein PINS_up002803 [Pythium insidiosum]